jgi:hypothetical protein
MYGARFFGCSNAEQAAAIMIKGQELGFQMSAAFEYIHIILGKVSLSPRGALALIHQHSDLIEVKIEESNDKQCTVWMRRKDSGFEFRRTFTIDEAEKAGLVKPDSGWEKWRTNMLMWRCVGFVADVVCPDLVGGMKRSDELGANIDAAGDVIEGQYTVQTPTPQEAAPTAQPIIEVSPVSAETATIPIDLGTLVSTYGPEKVMAACNGCIPGTDEEVAAAAAVLAASNG